MLGLACHGIDKQSGPLSRVQCGQMARYTMHGSANVGHTPGLHRLLPDSPRTTRGLHAESIPGPGILARHEALMIQRSVQQSCSDT